MLNTYPIDEDNVRCFTSIGRYLIRVLYYYIGYYFNMVNHICYDGQQKDHKLYEDRSRKFGFCKLAIGKNVSLANTRTNRIPDSEKTWTRNLRKRLQTSNHVPLFIVRIAIEILLDVSHHSWFKDMTIVPQNKTMQTNAANKFVLCVCVVIFMCAGRCVTELQPSSADAYQAFVCDRPAE